MPPRIEVAQDLGFCFGVSLAVSRAEQEARRGRGPVSTWGSLVHNRLVAEYLCSLGIQVASSLSDCLPGQTVILRSHGASPSERAALLALGCRIVDATCPRVAQIHKHVRLLEDEGRQVYLLGDAAHPEMIATAAHCHRPVIVENCESLREYFDLHPDQAARPSALLAQTTARRDIWENCVVFFKKLCTNSKIIDTICNTTLLRQSEASRMAARCGAMVVVGDPDSANTRGLADICRAGCRRVLFVEGAANWPSGWMKNQKNVGLTAGASTPPWVIEEVYRIMVEEIMNEATLAESPEPEKDPLPVSEAAPPPLEGDPPLEGGPPQEGNPPLEGNPSQEGDPSQDEDEVEESFEAMLEKSFRTIHTGDRVVGVVSAITSAEVHVDLGAKHAGYIPLTELSDDPDYKAEEMVRVGQEIEASVVRVNDVEGVIALSKRRLDSVNNWNDVEKARESHAVLSGIVLEENKGGVVVSVKGVRVFVPASLTGLPKDAPMSTLCKQRVKVVVTEVNRARRRVVGSIRAAQNEERRALADALWKDIEIGKKYEGTVKSLTSFGSFVDIGGVDGMVHVSELSWRRIKHPSEVVSVGQKINVYVIGFDPERKKISLGYKDPEENPWQKFINAFHVGDTANVRIVKLMPFGAFAEVIPGVDGLIHIGQITDRRIGKPGDVLTEGQQTDVKITAIDYEKKKISLSISALMGPSLPSEEAQARDAHLPDRVVAVASADDDDDDVDDVDDVDNVEDADDDDDDDDIIDAALDAPVAPVAPEATVAPAAEEGAEEVATAEEGDEESAAPVAEEGIEEGAEKVAKAKGSDEASLAGTTKKRKKLVP